MEFFHEPKIDWMGKKWYFIGLTLLLYQHQHGETSVQ